MVGVIVRVVVARTAGGAHRGRHTGAAFALPHALRGGLRRKLLQRVGFKVQRVAQIVVVEAEQIGRGSVGCVVGPIDGCAGHGLGIVGHCFL